MPARVEHQRSHAPARGSQRRLGTSFIRFAIAIRTTLESQRGPRDEATITFGFRHIERVGKEMRLNGHPIFLRGTLDCAVYPKTGHPPMTVPEWERVLGVIKEYGFNHVRFHTWCPPEAAFEAADRLGVYLQAEAPAWVDDWGTGTVTKPPAIGRDPEVTEFLRRGTSPHVRGLRQPSVVSALRHRQRVRNAEAPTGNASTPWWRKSRRSIRGGSTRVAARASIWPADDFWFTHDSGASTRGVGPAHTDWDFAKAAAALSPVPVIAHETGQRPVFPDYDALLPKFTGPLLPLNLERYRRALVANGLGGQMKDFVRASARFQLTQYKAEHEAMLRTRGYAGYQLLMLNDFTGQSEALVGTPRSVLGNQGRHQRRRGARLERAHRRAGAVREIRVDVR